ncbi:polyprenyl synthetase family protein [Heyndrickxia sporothermodurans]|uniref:Farnesyl diphosphate synthase n=1 Tax=Heyndrickxia sporothermodurans TaxID=46224 RepID=A0AB37HG51_9BACI|nr:farnesyl diphosphate synthase [Heyndrickxia sporothermodurans]MBL5766015.1 polyprenyl synthetase family protein [Heyndrickxia sporothermodurans]MBL5769456.1 polyprenyl synthetase family protein [Heyndrickxia sporothermodurans]MBL5773237.1 polyprenyl synthetase family protein [Heyndrickxia sporothermodurans]MBL5777131.1 polyprenyl synthetase family protein [Heyndrickxia sporothermodurans]MBL5782069.1 polyprenyl synthetase family protein [Heyndrickxia sporothermodurans]
MKKVNERLETELSQAIVKLHAPQKIKDAMAYSLQAGGKRIRPTLLLATLHAFGKEMKYGIKTACALEMVHTYSLIHDDLPAMDNDDLRRGKPTNHKVFGEAYSILAGDGLLTYSFQMIAQDSTLTSEQKVKIIELLAIAAGPEGMVGGQVADMLGEKQELSIEELEYIHRNKTGKLLTFSAVAGAIIAGASSEQIDLLKKYAENIGLAFQIRDDILDIEGKEEIIGKPVGSDEGNVKSTYPSLLTLDGAKERLHYHTNLAKDMLRDLNLDTKLLEELAELIVVRNH